jgi:hypothetical protein
VPDEDLNATSYGRLAALTPEQIPPLQQPGVEGRAAAADDFMRMGGLQAAPGVPLLDAKELPRARTLARVLAQLIQNTNLTAALPAHVSPPLWSDPVDLVARTTVQAAVMTDYVPVLTYRVPSGRWARIISYGVNVLDPLYTYNGSLLWRIRVNGNNVQTLADWGEQRGSVTIPRATVITLREDWVITFDVKRAVAAALPQIVVMALNGWSWRYRFNYEGTKNVLTST